MLERMWSNRNTLHCWWECKLVQPLWKTVWKFLKDLEMEIPFDPAIPLLCIYTKDYKSFYYKDICTCMFIVSWFIVAKTWNQQMPINDKLDKENVAHIHHWILCIKKGWINVLCRDMDENGNHLSQQTDREQKTEHHMFWIISGCWTMKIQGHRERNVTHWGLLGWGG